MSSLFLQIRKNALEKSIRDGDLISLEGFTTAKAEDDGPPPDLLDIVDSIEIDPAEFAKFAAAENNVPPPPIASPAPSAAPPVSQMKAPSAASAPGGAGVGGGARVNSRKSKRGRSLSSKFWLVNKLATNGKITYVL